MDTPALEPPDRVASTVRVQRGVTLAELARQAAEARAEREGCSFNSAL